MVCRGRDLPFGGVLDRRPASLAEDMREVACDLLEFESFWQCGHNQDSVVLAIELRRMDSFVVGLKDRSRNVKHDVDPQTVIGERPPLPDHRSHVAHESLVNEVVSWGRASSAHANGEQVGSAGLSDRPLPPRRCERPSPLYVYQIEGVVPPE